MLSLYIHIPFCVKKCRYCGFYSTAYTARSADDFVHAVVHEARRYAIDFDRRLFHTLYVGGGTPTALTSSQFGRIVTGIKDSFHFVDYPEFTVEANPNSITEHDLAFFLQLGVNRLSLGVQSFSDELLHTLGRLHSSRQAAEAFTRARQAGFKNIGIDVIYGIPGQTAAHWEETLNEALELQPEHVSAYALSLEEGSDFKRDVETARLVLPEDDQVAAMYERAVRSLVRAGYRRYEISNFAKPGFECRHNRQYWEQGEYLGLGPAAWSFLSGRRFHAIADVHAYCERLRSGSTVIEGDEVVGDRQSAAETLMLGLRMDNGVALERLERAFGRLESERIKLRLQQLTDLGLTRVRDGRLTLTTRGMLVSDEVIRKLAP